nr:MAG TPA: hypothetical protein [Caudoviricetes sp.]
MLKHFNIIHHGNPLIHYRAAVLTKSLTATPI